MAFAPILLMAASAAVAAYGKIQESQAQAASYKSQANAAQYNATVQMENANAATQAGSANELAQRRENDQRLGAMRAQIAQNGGGFGGTNAEVASQAATNAELDALNTRYRGQMQGRGLIAQAELQGYESRADLMNAKSSITAGYIGAASAALGSASNYSNYKNLSYGYGYG